VLDELHLQPAGLGAPAVLNLALVWVVTPAKAPTASKARRLERRRVFIGGISPENFYIFLFLLFFELEQTKTRMVLLHYRQLRDNKNLSRSYSQ
jgi:hypothetical protein